MPKFPPILNGLGRLASAVRWVSSIEEDARLEHSSELRHWLEKRHNRQAHDMVLKTWRILDDHNSAPELLAMRREALGRAQKARTVRRLSPNLVWTGPAAAVLLVSIVVFGFLTRASAPAIYSTGIGERRVVTLNDHSKIWLDASTVVAVQRYSGHSRELSLKKGRARFDVAPDKSRPFSVTSGSETTVAVGTSFNVEHLNGKIIVTVRHGHVLVKDVHDSGSSAPVVLGPNQQIVAKQDGRIAVQSISIETRDAWQRGKIVFDDQYLGDAVEQFNRYLAKPILVDAAIARIRIGGVFNAGDSRSFINAVANYFPVQAHLVANGQIQLMPKPTATPKQSAPDR